jgi:hypothetical protein
MITSKSRNHHIQNMPSHHRAQSGDAKIDTSSRNYRSAPRDETAAYLIVPFTLGPIINRRPWSCTEDQGRKGTGRSLRGYGALTIVPTAPPQQS